MFRNREIRVRMAKPNDKKVNDTTPETEERDYNFEEIAEIAKNAVTHVTLAIGGTVAAVKVVGAIAEIAVNRSKKDKE